MPGEIACAHDSFARSAPRRRANLLPRARQRISASHGPQPGRHAGLCRQGQPRARAGQRDPAVPGSRQGGADFRAGRPVPRENRIRGKMGASAMRTRVKICGITRPADAQAAAQAGADAIGLVFYPPSPRFLSVERAVEIRDALPPFVQTVALFVNPDAAQVAQVIGRVRPALLQFHGGETPEFCGQFGVPFVKACRMRPGDDALEYLRPFSRAAAWLFDSHVPEYGGVGEGFDLSLMPVVKEKPVILSGGLSRANVAEAIRRVRPWGVDVSSGVRSEEHTS